jgi:hypothetical protein
MLVLWFYDPSKDTEGALNKLVSALDGPFCHCELQFEDGVSCSIYLGTSIFLKKREFDTDYYTRVDFPCTSIQEKEARAKAHALERQGLKCTFMALTSCALGLKSDSTHTFCSKLVADILQHAGLVDNLNTDTLTPSALYRHVSGIRKRGTSHDNREYTITPIDFKNIKQPSTAGLVLKFTP